MPERISDVKMGLLLSNQTIYEETSQQDELKLRLSNALSGLLIADPYKKA